MKIHITEDAADVRSELMYVLKIFGVNKKCQFTFVDSKNEADFTIGNSPDSNFRISPSFLAKSLSKNEMNSKGVFQLENGEPDLLATVFFCLALLQEHNDNDPDDFGRFKFLNSYQYKLGIVTENVVQMCFDQLASRLNIKSSPDKSSFLLSHDIDSVYGSILEDGFNVAKKGRLDLLLKLIMNTAMDKPNWFNIDQILKIESEYDCRSVFYWIVNKGRTQNAENSDYDFKSKKIQNALREVKETGSENGLHKSISKESFESEIRKFGELPLGNRYHYLKFKLPEGFDEIEKSGIKLDSSLGFSEHHGFRNGYGLPYNPFNVKEKRPYTFVEAGLHVMDRTFFAKRMDVKEVEKNILDFLDRHRENCVLSILWHNNFFTDYKFKGYLALYKKMLSYIKDGDFRTIDQPTIIQKYSIAWP
jgi:hypothetical protein